MPPSAPDEPVDETLFASLGGHWQARWAHDPKPVWARHRLWSLLSGPSAGWHARIDRWWQAHRRPSVLWASSHAVAGRVPALVASGHREALWAHADHLARHPSRYSSANNHRVAELAALWLVRAALPDAPWPCDELPQVLADQLHPDGWPREQSVAYLTHVLEWGALAHCAHPSAALAAPLGRGLAALCTALTDRGHAFSIGDDGGDEVLPGDAPYAHDVAGCVASLLQAPGPPGWAPGQRAAWLGLHAAPPVRPPWRGSFPAGGLTVLRSPRAQVLFDHGPVGMAPLAGHGHADALALWLALDGHPVLGSRGTSAYHQPRVRERERGSTSHSTVMVGGRSSSVPHDHPFLWHTQAAAVLEHVRLQGHGGEVAAHHRGWPTVTPHRHVQLDPGQLRVSDHLRGAGRGLVTRRWHLAPGWTATVDRRVVRLRGPGPEVELQPAGPVRLEPWPHAVGYGEQVPAVTIVEEQPHRFPVDLVSTFRWSTERRGGHLAHQQACPSHGA